MQACTDCHPREEGYHTEAVGNRLYSKEGRGLLALGKDD